MPMPLKLRTGCGQRGLLTLHTGEAEGESGEKAVKHVSNSDSIQADLKGDEETNTKRLDSNQRNAIWWVHSMPLNNTAIHSHTATLAGLRLLRSSVVEVRQGSHSERGLVSLHRRLVGWCDESGSQMAPFPTPRPFMQSGCRPGSGTSPVACLPLPCRPSRVVVYTGPYGCLEPEQDGAEMFAWAGIE